MDTTVVRSNYDFKYSWEINAATHFLYYDIVTSSVTRSGMKITNALTISTREPTKGNTGRVRERQREQNE